MSLETHRALRRLWRPLAQATLLVAALFPQPSRASARDLAKNDRDRKAILDSARGTENVKFNVKDLFKAGDFAFLCALMQEPGGPVFGTDDMIDVYEWVLVRDESGRWLAQQLGGGFAPNVKSVYCEVDPTSGAAPAIASQKDIVHKLEAHLRDELVGTLVDGGSIEGHMPLLDLLARRGFAEGFGIDREKPPLPADRVARMVQTCADAACKAGSKRLLTRIERARKAPKVSAFLWEHCEWRARRSLSLSGLDQCLQTGSALPACRSGLRVPQQRREVEQCLAALATPRQSTATDTVAPTRPADP